MPTINLICLDFDGTIMTYDEDPAGVFHPAIIERLNGLPSRGVSWCTNSGRDYENQVDILARSEARGLTGLPDALMCSESLLYHRRDGCYTPHADWNKRVEQMLQSYHAAVQAALNPVLEDLASRYEPEEVKFEPAATVFCIPGEREVQEQFRAELQDLLAQGPGGQVTRNGGWVVALPVELGKGPVLRVYLREQDIAPENVLAVGDHHNDLSMLDGSSAGHCGCPADAIPEVIRVVQKAGGHVAVADGPLGTLEILDRFLVD